MKQAFAHALKERGILGIQLGFEDPNSQFLLDIVEAMGCTPDSHSNRQGALVSHHLYWKLRLPKLTPTFSGTSHINPAESF